METQFFGIRHHGPGCAHSLLNALNQFKPDCLLIEGPPEGEKALSLCLHEDMKPPVALLIFAPEQPNQAAFYPFAVFSPEWQAIRYGLTHQLPIRMMDLDLSHRFALNIEKQKEAEQKAQEIIDKIAAEENKKDSKESISDIDNHGFSSEKEIIEKDENANQQNDVDQNEQDSNQQDFSSDPMDWLAKAAGEEDGEAWWSKMVEERGNDQPLALFKAINEAMSALREHFPTRESDLLREAAMRKIFRQAQKDGFQRIAVICGAWHVPALVDLPPAKSDLEMLKNLPKIKVEAAWSIWSDEALSMQSGYGAGIQSPAWYEHIWNNLQHKTSSEEICARWFSRAARLFRDADLDCSSAHVIEATRLAHTLANMRERVTPDLPELIEALRAVVTMGADEPIQLIHKHLVLGQRLGEIPADAPITPLQRDLLNEQKRLRFKPEAEQKTLDLDLRKENDLARSHLLHRLTLLGIHWGTLSTTGKSAKGTFHEIWQLQWKPELTLDIAKANALGNTIFDAANAKVRAKAKQNDPALRLPELSELIQSVLLAHLPDALEPVSKALQERASVSSDVQELLMALPALANTARYGNVRQTDSEMVKAVFAAIIPRAAIGLSSACRGLDEEQAAQLNVHIQNAHQAIQLIGTEDQITKNDQGETQISEGEKTQWQNALKRVADVDSQSSSPLHPLIAGLAARLLFDAQTWNIQQMSQRMYYALSQAQQPMSCAAWLEGFLNKSAMILLHDDVLWQLIDAWLQSIQTDHFKHVLPLLRRTFSSFESPERRQLAERAVQMPAILPIQAIEKVETLEIAPIAESTKTENIENDSKESNKDKGSQAIWDENRAILPIPLLRLILGLKG